MFAERKFSRQSNCKLKYAETFHPSNTIICLSSLKKHEVSNVSVEIRIALESLKITY